MAGESMSAADYIKHHLQSLTSLSDVSKGQGLRNIADFPFYCGFFGDSRVAGNVVCRS